MTRHATLLSMMLVVALGFSLFKVKYEVQGLDEQIGQINRQINEDQDAIHVLNAQWSYMTQPQRLGELSQRHLSLQPITSAQLGSLDQLPMKNDQPAVGAPVDEPTAAVLKAMQVAFKPGTPGAGTLGANSKTRTEQ